jgi:transposase InsO family protein
MVKTLERLTETCQADGQKISMLTVTDEFTRESLAIKTARRLRAENVLETMADLFELHGPPMFIRSDNGPEFVATALRKWFGRPRPLNFERTGPLPFRAIRYLPACWDYRSGWQFGRQQLCHLLL